MADRGSIYGERTEPLMPTRGGWGRLCRYWATSGIAFILSMKAATEGVASRALAVMVTVQSRMWNSVKSAEEGV